jgi:hypothetical protein
VRRGSAGMTVEAGGGEERRCHGRIRGGRRRARSIGSGAAAAMAGGGVGEWWRAGGAAAAHAVVRRGAMLAFGADGYAGVCFQCGGRACDYARSGAVLVSVRVLCCFCIDGEFLVVDLRLIMCRAKRGSNLACV